MYLKTFYDYRKSPHDDSNINMLERLHGILTARRHWHSNVEFVGCLYAVSEELIDEDSRG